MQLACENGGTMRYGTKKDWTGRCKSYQLNQRPTMVQRERRDLIVACPLVAVAVLLAGYVGHSLGWALGCAVFGVPL